jgi:A nuclease family of the HNH/ENDO VII superfamily with conserved AHH
LVEFDPSMADAQRILNRFGINPNEAANGVWLDRSYHRQLHTNEYQAWVTAQLERVVEAGGGRNEIVRELQNIAAHLRNGKPIPVKPPK